MLTIRLTKTKVRRRKRVSSLMGSFGQIQALLLTTAIVCFGCGRVHSEEPVLRLAVEHAVQGPDSVVVNVVFANNTDKDIVIYNWKGGGGTLKGAIGAFLTFIIVDLTNEDTLRFDYRGPVPKRPHEKDTVVVGPEDTYEEALVLNTFYLNSETIAANVSSGVANRDWLPGDYSVRSIYEYAHNPDWIGGQNLWEGKLESNEILISVRRK